MVDWSKLAQPEMLVICGVLAIIIIMLVAIMLKMNRREREQQRQLSDMERMIYESSGEAYENAASQMRVCEQQLSAECERGHAERDELARQLEALRGESRELAQAAGARLDAALQGLDGLSGQLARLSAQVEGLGGALDMPRLRERLGAAPWGDMPEGRLEALLMQWFEPGRYVRRFEIGTGSGRYADVAILLPDDAGRVLYLPVDMSFPVEQFAGESDARLNKALVEYAARLAAELIKPGLTTDFAILLLRRELSGARMGELEEALERAQLVRRVIVVGPTAFWSIARTLDGGASAQELRRSARRLEQLVHDVRGELNQFARMLNPGEVASDSGYQSRRKRRQSTDAAPMSSEAGLPDAGGRDAMPRAEAQTPAASHGAGSMDALSKVEAANEAAQPDAKADCIGAEPTLAARLAATDCAAESAVKAAQTAAPQAEPGGYSVPSATAPEPVRHDSATETLSGAVHPALPTAETDRIGAMAKPAANAADGDRSTERPAQTQAGQPASGDPCDALAPREARTGAGHVTEPHPAPGQPDSPAPSELPTDRQFEPAGVPARPDAPRAAARGASSGPDVHGAGSMPTAPGRPPRHRHARSISAQPAPHAARGDGPLEADWALEAQRLPVAKPARAAEPTPLIDQCAPFEGEVDIWS